MEYNYQNSASDKPCVAVLNEFNITFYGIREEAIVIPYAQIIEVQLLKNASKNFKTIITTEGRNSIHISNYFYTDQKQEDHSRSYSTFVRVLHYHLKDKSRATFISGKKASKLWRSISIAVFTSFFISFGAAYLGLRLVDPFVQAMVMATMLGVAIVAVNISTWPRQYQPTDIPLELLP